jgi:hypothetical protein
VFIYIVAVVLLVVSLLFILKLVNLTDLVQLSVDNFSNLEPREKKILSLVHQNFIKKTMNKQIISAIIAISTSVLCCFLTHPINNLFGVGLYALGAILIIMAVPTFIGVMLSNLLVALPEARRLTPNEAEKT